MRGELFGLFFNLFGCLEVFGGRLEPGSYYFGGWMGWKLEIGGWKVEKGGPEFEYRGGVGQLFVVFGPWGEDIQEGGKLISHSLVAPCKQGLAD